MDFDVKLKQVKLNPRESRIMKDMIATLLHMARIVVEDDSAAVTAARQSLEALSARCVHPAEPKPKNAKPA